MNKVVELKKIIISVTSDLSCDQRVHKVSLTLQSMGFDVLLIGRKRKKSSALTNRPYKIKRLNLFFEKGPFFYFEYNFRLFWILLFQKATIVVSNDLDTLLANYLVSKFRNFKLVYDSHELYTELPELENRPLVKKIWLTIEKLIMPKLKYCYTVSQPIADYYYNNYKTNFVVIRNLPLLNSFEIKRPENNPKIIIYQGSVNKDRGVGLMINAVLYLESVEFWIIGTGDKLEEMKKLSIELKVENKIRFFGEVPFEKLIEITIQADLGISLENPKNLNYQYSLPNKVFDYINSGVPILASSLLEVNKIIEKYNIGMCVTNYTVEEVVIRVNEIFNNVGQFNTWRENTKYAREELCWEKESIKLVEIYNKVSNE